jgi:hypothetical protein
LAGLTETNSGWIGWEFFVYFSSVIVVLFWRHLKEKNLTWLMYLITVLPSIPMSLYKPADSQNVIPLTLGFFNLFYIQGFLDQTFQEDHRSWLGRASWVTSPMITFVVLLFAILGVACAQQKLYTFMVLVKCIFFL